MSRDRHVLTDFLPAYRTARLPYIKVTTQDDHAFMVRIYIILYTLTKHDNYVFQTLEMTVPYVYIISALYVV